MRAFQIILKCQSHERLIIQKSICYQLVDEPCSSQSLEVWARLRVWARRTKEDKLNEMQITGCEITVLKLRISSPNPLVKQANNTKGYH